MKKLLTALALVLALTGCASEPKEDETPKGPAAIATLDAATFAGEMETTAIENVKVDTIYVDEEGAHEIEERLAETETELRTSVVNSLKSLTLTKAESQEKVYGDMTLFIDLYTVLDTNYARLALFNIDGVEVLVVKTNEGFVNYTVDEAASTTLATISNEIVAHYTAEAE